MIGPPFAGLTACIESTYELIWSVDLDHRLVTFNLALRQAILNAYGVEVEAQMRLADLLPPDRASALTSYCKQALAEGPFQVESSLLDGRPLCMAFHPIVENGQASGVSVYGKRVAEHRTGAQARAESEEIFRQFFEANGSVMLLIEPTSGAIVNANQAASDYYGYTRKQLLAMAIQQINILPLDQVRSQWQRAFQNECNHFNFSHRLASGELRDVEVYSSPLDVAGRPMIFSIIHDVTEQKRNVLSLAASQIALRASEARYRAAFQTSETRYRTAFEVSQDPCAISRLADGAFIEVNAAFVKTLGYEREQVVGRTSRELCLFPREGDRERMVERVRRDSFCHEFEVKLRRKNGEVFWGAMSASMIELEGVPHIFSSLRDLSPAQAAEDEIYKLGYYDPLTCLPNRRLLLDRLRHALVAGTGGLKQTLMLVDLYNFKALNDTLGHSTGDLMLKEVARRMTACVRETDTVARFGGDEFAVMLEDLGRDPQEVATHAKTVADKILSAIGEPYLLDGQECRGAASVGVTVFGGPQDSTLEVLQQVEIALYEAKSAGRNSIHYFVPALQEAVNARATLEEDLRRAIERDEFVLYYQPQVERGRVTGVESLIRWRHPARGLLVPKEFISLTEETGLILPVGKWCLEVACAQLAAWSLRKETAPLTIAVNISAVHIRQPEFVPQVLTALDRAGAKPERLRLELTETVLVNNVEDTIAKMAELRSHGVRFCLDDFGTGYSSMAYLNRLPLDRLKIDRSFIEDLHTGINSGAIAAAIVSLGRALKLSVIAEGVETEEQRAFLAGLGCHKYQGFLCSPALPLKECEAFLADFNRAAGKPGR